jgi:hypothetical protein
MIEVPRSSSRSRARVNAQLGVVTRRPRTQDDALRNLARQEHARRRGEQIELALVAPHDDRGIRPGGGCATNGMLHRSPVFLRSRQPPV